MHRYLLGFDIRLCWQDYVRADWDESRRTVFLLKPGVKWPISVDENVWPSVFAFEERDAQTCQTGLWRNLKDLKSHFLAGNHTRWRKGILIGVVLHSEADLTKDTWWRRRLRHGLGIELLPKEWNFLGYDIADSGKMSGLTNCGWNNSEEKAAAEKDWGNKLNEFGMITDVGDAIRFRNLADRREPTHAPYFVYELYRDPETFTAA